MNYELARQLKEKGFPQKKLEISGVYVGICKHGIYGYSEGRESCECGEAETVHLPTLSELIEACDLGFRGLKHNIWDGWTAYSFLGKEKGKGATPEEAVANLWLWLKEIEV